MTSVESPTVAATWNNNIQALVEGIWEFRSTTVLIHETVPIKMLNTRVLVALSHNGQKN
jgi:hypothetical protein